MEKDSSMHRPNFLNLQNPNIAYRWQCQWTFEYDILFLLDNKQNVLWYIAYFFLRCSTSSTHILLDKQSIASLAGNLINFKIEM